MTLTKNDATINMQTLSECMAAAVKNGYSENFKVLYNCLATADEKKFYIPLNIAITNFYRFEGYTNPDDSSILYLIETNDGIKGTLIDAYGVYADAHLSNYIRQVKDIHKQVIA